MTITKSRQVITTLGGATVTVEQTTCLLPTPPSARIAETTWHVAVPSDESGNLAVECGIIGEAAMAAIWDTPEEDAAWAHLQ